MNSISPTAANIIASLGIKGATTGENLPGYVPVLGDDGKLSAKFIPANAAQLALPTLSNVAVVDPYTDVSESERNGSVVAPFRSLAEAAARFVPSEDAADAKTFAFLLAPGEYTDDSIVFPSSRAPLSVYMIGLSGCTLSVGSFTVYGMSRAHSGRRPSILLDNVTATGRVVVTENADVTVLGRSYLPELNGADGMTLLLADESRVDSTNAMSVSFLSEDARIGNTSEAKGATVRDALTRLTRRKIRLARVTAGSSGFDIDPSSSYLDLAEDSSSPCDIYDLRARDRIFVDGINRLFRRGRNIEADSVHAQTVVADVVDVQELRMNALTLGGYRLTIDLYGYLVVKDGSDDPPRPPSSVFKLMDSVTGAIYILGVADGRMYLLEDDGDSSSDSSSSEIPRQLKVYDPESGYTYAVTIEDGQMIITRIGE